MVGQEVRVAEKAVETAAVEMAVVALEEAERVEVRLGGATAVLVAGGFERIRHRLWGTAKQLRGAREIPYSRDGRRDR